jgi:hypothetical protein
MANRVKKQQPLLLGDLLADIACKQVLCTARLSDAAHHAGQQALLLLAAVQGHPLPTT